MLRKISNSATGTFRYDVLTPSGETRSYTLTTRVPGQPTQLDTGLTATGRYTITETDAKPANLDWSLVSASCGGLTRALGEPITVDVGTGSAPVCTFVNEPALLGRIVIRTVTRGGVGTFGYAIQLPPSAAHPVDLAQSATTTKEDTPVTAKGDPSDELIFGTLRRPAARSARRPPVAAGVRDLRAARRDPPIAIRQGRRRREDRAHATVAHLRVHLRQRPRDHARTARAAEPATRRSRRTRTRTRPRRPTGGDGGAAGGGDQPGGGGGGVTVVARAAAGSPAAAPSFRPAASTRACARSAASFRCPSATVPPSSRLPWPAPSRRPASRFAFRALASHTALQSLPLRADGSLAPPASAAQAGWWRGGARPGAVGTAVIAGHVDSTAGPGVFARLDRLVRGDRIVVTTGARRVRYVVTGVAQYAKHSFPTQRVYGPTPVATLRLITCAGPFNALTGHYRDNLVVFARRA